MLWNNGRPNLPTGVDGTVASSCPSRSTMKLRMPLSKSASASQVISTPWSGLADIRTLVGAGGGVVSLTAPVLTYSIHALATASLGNQTASLGLPVKASAGWAVSPSKCANHALLWSRGLRG